MRIAFLLILLPVIWGCGDNETPVTPDTLPPAVVVTYPADGDSNVPLCSPITCTFSEAMNSSSLNDSSFIVNWITNFPGVITCVGNKATFNHAAPMRNNSLYRATIRNTVKDLAGNALPKEYVWEFTTAAGPSVIETYPQNGDTGVNLNTVITAIFSDPMDPASLDTSTFKLSDGVTGTVSGIGSEAVFDPDVLLVHDHTYTATITKYVTDTAGNNMANAYYWSFTTTGGPLISATYPADGAVAVAVDDAISVMFSADMDPTALTPSTFFLSDGVIGEVTYDNRTATFTPEDTLMRSHTYTATITTGVRDIDGNAMAADYVWSFSIPGVIMPLTIGNSWYYHVETWDTMGTKISDFHQTTEIVRDTVIDDELWYIDNTNGKYANRADGLWMYSVDGNPCLLAKFPAEVDDIYTGCRFYYLTYQVEVLSLDWQVTVDPGTYSCHRYYMYYGNEATVYYYYYSPTIGLVLRETFMLHNYKNWPVRIERVALEGMTLQ